MGIVIIFKFLRDYIYYAINCNFPVEKYELSNFCLFFLNTTKFINK